MLAIAGGILLAIYILFLIGSACEALGRTAEWANESLKDIAKKYLD